MTQHKTLAECKDEISRNYGFKDWSTFLLSFNGKFTTIRPKTFDEAIDKAYELHASQFVSPLIDIKDIDPEIGAAFNEFSKQNRRRTPKRERESQFIKKDETISDKQIVDEIKLITDWPDVHDGPQNITVNTAIKLVRKWQSTQQPATINFFSDDAEKLRIVAKSFDVADLTAKGHLNDNEVQTDLRRIADLIEKQLKDRVNCVDPWISVNDRLPELEQEVLSFSPNEGIRQTKYTTYQEGSTGHSQGDKDCWFEWATHNNFAWKHRATHWMPLINSPKTTPNGQK